MADSPGALLPGSTPEAASNAIVKWMLTAQGLTVVAVGAWWFLLRKKPTKKNPRRRR